MTTSGTYAGADFEYADVVAEAFERIGIDPATITARHTRSARRSIEYLFVEWANEGVHLWAVDQQTLAAPTLVAGTATYNTPDGTIAVLEMIVRRDGVDTPVWPMARDEYMVIPDKTSQGLPNRFYLDRARDTPTFTLWNVPENATDTILYYRMRRIQDVGGSSYTADVPYRWQEAMVAGLASKLAEKYAPEREQAMVAKYAMKYKSAYTEDRERTPTATRVKYSTGLRRK